MSGVVLPRAGQGPLVRLGVRGRRGSLEMIGRLDLVVRDVEQARALLHALGLDATQRVATFAWSSRVFADRRILGLTMAPIFAVLAPLVLSAWMGVVLLMPLLLLLNGGFAWLVVAMSWPTTISVGADGVAVT